MHKNIKSSVSFFMSFLMFCQIGGYSGAEAPKDVKPSSNLSFWQKVEAFFKTTIPNHPGETAGVCGGVGLLTAIAIALKIKKPWRHKQEQVDESVSPEIENESKAELLGGDTGGKNKANSDGADGQPAKKARTLSADGARFGESEKHTSGRQRANSEGGSPRKIPDDNSSTSTDGTGSVAPTEEVSITDDVGQRDGGVPETKGENQDALLSQPPTGSTATNTITTTSVLPDSNAAVLRVTMPPVDRALSPNNLAPNVPQQPFAAASPEPRSPSPDEPKQNEELQIELTTGVKNKLCDFIKLLHRQKEKNLLSLFKNFVQFLAQIEPCQIDTELFFSIHQDPGYAPSGIENNAVCCLLALSDWHAKNLQQRPSSLPTELNQAGSSAEKFDDYLQQCFGPHVKKYFPHFRQNYLHEFDVVTDGSNPNKKIVKLKTETV